MSNPIIRDKNNYFYFKNYQGEKKIRFKNKDKKADSPSYQGKGKDYNQMKLNHWKGNIKKLYLFQFLMNFFMVSGVLIPFFTDWGKLTFFEAMLVQSYFMIMLLIFEIPCGALGDLTSRRFSLLLGAISGAIGAMIYSIFPSIINFIIGETFFAFSMASISGTDQAIMYDTLKKLDQKDQLTKKMGNIRTFFMVSLSISAPIGSIIAEFISIQMSMFLMFLPFSFAAIVALTIKEPNETIEITKQDNYYKIVKSGLKELRKNRILRILGLEYILVDALVFFLIWTCQPYLEILNIPIRYYGIVATLMTISQVVFTNILTYIEKKLQKKSLFIHFYTIIPGALFILMAYIKIIPVSVCLIIIIIGIGLSRNILFIKGINHQIKTDNRATVLSTINMFESILKAILYPLVGLVITWNLDAAYILLGILIILSVIFSRLKNEFL